VFRPHGAPKLAHRFAVVLGAWVTFAVFEDDARGAAQTFVVLEYGVPADASGCPDVDEFRAGVARQLHYDPFRPAADRRVAVQIGRREVGFDGRIRWTDADGRWVGDRRLTSRRSDCGEIAASLAFSVAVQVQLLTALAPPAPKPVEAPAAPVAPPAAPDATATIVAPPPPTVVTPLPEPAPSPPARRWMLSVGLGPALALGVAPQATGVARLFVSGRLTWLSLELGLDAAWPATRNEADGSGFSLDRYAGEAAACGHARAVAACVIGTLGILRARGTGVDAPAAPSGVFSQAGARIAATLDFGDRYFATARLDGLVMLSSWTVTLNQSAAWTTPRVGALIGIDVGARFF
jgi:hypothetical protein